MTQMQSWLAGRRKLLIGVVHLPPLPGAPGWRGDFSRVLERAAADARAYERGEADAIVVENFGDVPFGKGPVPPETVAAMAVAGRVLSQQVRLPIGFNVLRNDARAGLALCAACGGRFIRVNVHCGAMLTDQGVIEGAAHDTMRIRRHLCPPALIFADVQVKHAVPLAPMPIEIAARDTQERGLADALIVSGTGTGVATALADVQRVRQACPGARVLVGSGATAANAGAYLRYADGLIVGSSLKRDSRIQNPVETKRVRVLARIVHAAAPARRVTGKKVAP